MNCRIASMPGRMLIVLMALAVAAATMPARAAPYTVTGPEGNTITLDENSVSGTFEGVDYYADENEATADGRGAAEDDDGGGGGGGNGAAIVAGLAVVAIVAGVGLWWYFAKYKPQQAAKAQEAEAQIALHQFGESTSLTVTPKMLQMAGMDTAAMPDPDVKDLSSFEVALRVRF